MKQNIFRSIRGMQDILPEVAPDWHALESILKTLLQNYAYQEIRLPIVENTELFYHSIGQVTDIIQKEMYHLASSAHEQSLSLRPEGTASCVRACIEHDLLSSNVTQRFWYMGPMFRRERPQKGRYRQFHQLGVEAFGITHPSIEVELIAMTHRLWKLLGIHSEVRLELNSLGKLSSRQRYRGALVDYFTQYMHVLDEDSKKRLHDNPLRILDSKNPSIIDLKQNAPKLSNYLDPDSQLHFERLKKGLEQLKIPFVVNESLVRGLDYYNDTVFEWVMTDTSGAQNTICAGGRYDTLVEQLKGPATPAVGFAIGLERLLALWGTLSPNKGEKVRLDLYIIYAKAIDVTEGILLAEQLRNALPSLNIQLDMSQGSFRQQFKRANRSGACFALVVGEEEYQNHTFTLKPLREAHQQLSLTWLELIKYLTSEIK